jgi:methionyl-tRNA formyltransferase
VPITTETTADQLHDKLAGVGAELLVETLEDLEAGRLNPIRQDEDQATVAPMLSREDGLVDWHWKASKIDCRMRGFHPWPGSHTTFRGRQLKVFPPVQILAGVTGDEPPGTILATTANEGLTVRCGDGALVLSDVQLQNKKRMSAHQFATGARLKPGDMLGG